MVRVFILALLILEPNAYRLKTAEITQDVEGGAESVSRLEAVGPPQLAARAASTAMTERTATEKEKQEEHVQKHGGQSLASVREHSEAPSAASTVSEKEAESKLMHAFNRGKSAGNATIIEEAVEEYERASDKRGFIYDMAKEQIRHILTVQAMELDRTFQVPKPKPKTKGKAPKPARPSTHKAVSAKADLEAQEPPEEEDGHCKTCCDSFRDCVAKACTRILGFFRGTWSFYTWYMDVHQAKCCPMKEHV